MPMPRPWSRRQEGGEEGVEGGAKPRPSCVGEEGEEGGAKQGRGPTGRGGRGDAKALVPQVGGGGGRQRGRTCSHAAIMALVPHGAPLSQIC